MSAARDKIKREHEQANIQAFIRWHRARHHSAFRVISEPDPPDAIITSGRTVRWVESATVFWTKDYARDEYSYATPGETHKPMPAVPFHGDMDKVFADRFVTLLRQKLEKSSYEKYRDQYGAGYLILRMFSPFFDGETVRHMKEAWSAAPEIADRGCFRSVYIAFRSLDGLAFQRWRLRGLSTQQDQEQDTSDEGGNP